MSEKDIDFVQNFVRNDLLKILNDKCVRANKVFNENDMHHFFGNYQGSPQDFHILLGERKLLLAAAREVNRMNESLSFGDYLKFFAVPEKYAISNKNSDKFSVGLYFGKKDRIGMTQVPLSNEVMAAQVMAKVEPLFNKFIDCGLKAVRNVTQDIVKIINFETGTRADVICVFCAMNEVDIAALQKTIAIQYEFKRGSTSGSWNTTNLKKHLQRHLIENSSKQPKQEKLVNELAKDSGTHSPRVNLKNTPDALMNNDQPDLNNEMANCIFIPLPSDENSISFEQMTSQSNSGTNSRRVKLESTPDALVNYSQPDLDIEMANSVVVTLPDNEKSIFFEQMSLQNLRMMRAALENEEHKKVMVLKCNGRFDTIDVLEIDPDGNCLYGACVHQIHATKLGTTKHYEMVAALRKDVVDHILKNFHRYVRVLKYRVEEEAEIKTGQKPKNVNENQCKLFVDKYLSRAGNWAGAESLMAISEIYQTNIIGFNENDKFYFATGYNASYNRFIFIAYRMNSNSEYYHYNSVCGINAELMYKCVDNLSKVVFNANDVQTV